MSDEVSINNCVAYIEAFNSLERAILINSQIEARQELGEQLLQLRPSVRDLLAHVVRYRRIGLNNLEISKLLERPKSTVEKVVAAARKLDLLPSAGQTAGVQS
ncbi:hypothetical protein [Desulfovibrio inopinatus]|uniref:hypothetical protein n=1 Tax=Desulfovibrio inopinatus TaxID=102109 RepID=UPI000416241B|nr:hypothetical protein [Desulfovibrio inopinatus]